MKNLKFAVTLGSVQQRYLDDVVKPTKQYATYDQPAEMFAALRAHQIDAVLIDVPVALPYAAESNGAVKVYAQIKAGGKVGIVMQKGTPNRKPINTMVHEMLKSGTLKKLEKKYYFAAYGGIDPDSLPRLGIARAMQTETRDSAEHELIRQPGASGDWRPRRARCRSTAAAVTIGSRQSRSRTGCSGPTCRPCAAVTTRGGQARRSVLPLSQRS